MLNGFAFPLNPNYYEGVPRRCSQSSTSSTTGSSGGIGWDWGDVLDSADSETVTGEGSDGGLGTWTDVSGLVASSSSQLDVDGVDTDILEGLADVDGSKHS